METYEQICIKYLRFLIKHNINRKKIKNDKLKCLQITQKEAKYFKNYTMFKIVNKNI